MTTPKTIGVEARFKTPGSAAHGRAAHVFTDREQALAAVRELIRDGAVEIIVTPDRHPTARLRDEFMEYLRKSYDSVLDVRCYFPEEWRRRGERYGEGALLTATIEGHPLSRDLNGYSEDKGARRRYEAFDRWCEERGYFWELGYSWSLHFYPRGT